MHLADSKEDRLHVVRLVQDSTERGVFKGLEANVEGVQDMLYRSPSFKNPIEAWIEVINGKVQYGYQLAIDSYTYLQKVVFIQHIYKRQSCKCPVVLLKIMRHMVRRAEDVGASFIVISTMYGDGKDEKVTQLLYRFGFERVGMAMVRRV